MASVQSRASRVRPNLLIGIDDTDQLEGKGTGFLARRLLERLAEAGLGSGVGITRHQLLVDPAIPYTSHNSSACLAWCLPEGLPQDRLIEAAAAFLEAEAAPGSDPGLAVVPRHGAVPPTLLAYGQQAKTVVLDQPAAQSAAAALGVHLSAHGGTGGGIIGALAATGLHWGGEDGWFLWMPGIRGLEGSRSYAQLLAEVPVDAARTAAGDEPAPEDVVDLGDWVRPVLTGGEAVLLVERAAGDSPGPEAATWRVADRETVKAR